MQGSYTMGSGPRTDTEAGLTQLVIYLLMTGLCRRFMQLAAVACRGVHDNRMNKCLKGWFLCRQGIRERTISDEVLTLVIRDDLFNMVHCTVQVKIAWLERAHRLNQARYY